MRFSRAVSVVDAHAEGESGKVVVDGIGPVPGESVFDKMRYFQEHYDQLRKLLLQEPRGAMWHNTDVVLPSHNAQADMGDIILESTEYPVMSGSNTMCVATVLLETGMLPMTEPVTHLTLESPAGLIRVECECVDGKVRRVKLVNQPSFVYHKSADLDVPGLGRVTVDIAYGGMTFVFVDAESLGFKLDVSEEAALCELGQRLRKAAVNQSDVSHPENPLSPASRARCSPARSALSRTRTAPRWSAPGTRPSSLPADRPLPVRQGHLRPPRRPARLRSAGTGTALPARVAHRQPVRRPYRVHPTVGPYDSVVSSISGRAWITSFNQLVLDPTDPFQNGFVMGRPWEPEV